MLLTCTHQIVSPLHPDCFSFVSLIARSSFYSTLTKREPLSQIFSFLYDLSTNGRRSVDESVQDSYWFVVLCGYERIYWLVNEMSNKRTCRTWHDHNTQDWDVKTNKKWLPRERSSKSPSGSIDSRNNTWNKE